MNKPLIQVFTYLIKVDSTQTLNQNSVCLQLRTEPQIWFDDRHEWVKKLSATLISILESNDDLCKNFVKKEVLENLALITLNAESIYTDDKPSHNLFASEEGSLALNIGYKMSPRMVRQIQRYSKHEYVVLEIKNDLSDLEEKLLSL